MLSSLSVVYADSRPFFIYTVLGMVSSATVGECGNFELQMQNQILISGDIQLNPGPVKLPCVVHKRAFANSQ